MRMGHPHMGRKFTHLTVLWVHSGIDDSKWQPSLGKVPEVWEGGCYLQLRIAAPRSVTDWAFASSTGEALISMTWAIPEPGGEEQKKQQSGT